MTDTEMTGVVTQSRRQFLRGAAVLLVGFSLPRGMATSRPAGAALAQNGFVRIDESGDIALIIPQVEMGQGTYTSLSMILAEELDADWSKVRVKHAPADEKLYANPMLSIQATGNSNSVRAFWRPMREAAASTRECLVQAAAARWGVAPSDCRTERSEVFHDPSARSIEYAKLVGQAARIKPPEHPVLKDPSRFSLIGRAVKRLDTPTKVTGEATYGIDARPAGVTFATLIQSPVIGGRVGSVNDSRAKAVPGVRQIIVLDDLVAVVGEHMWAAKCGLDALEVRWDDGPNGGVSSELIWSRLRAASRREGSIAKNEGDVEGLSLRDAEVVTLEYEMPLLAHACMEPLNCTVHVTPSRAEVWIGTQAIERVRQAVANAAGLAEAQVQVNNHLLGGGFGRRLEADMAHTAARIAKQVNGPVKVIWTREEDIRHDYLRPAYHNRLTAQLRNGRIVGWQHRVSGSAVIARFLPAFFQKGVDPDGVDSAWDMPYDIPNRRVEFNREEPPGVHTGFWRGVGPNNNVFAIEAFMDELARRAGRDPIEFRHAHLANTPRLQRALELVKEKSGWGTALPVRCGRGVSAQTSFASFIATVVECGVDDQGEVKLRRVTTVVDTGLAVNPDTVVAQLQGGLIFGLTAALYGEITLEKGRIRQSNFHDYRMLRIDQIPPIAVYVVKSGEAPGGIGETGTTSAVPALRNAIFAATGVALRRMPIDRQRLAKVTQS